jgi:hypothetical protein
VAAFRLVSPHPKAYSLSRAERRSDLAGVLNHDCTLDSDYYRMAIGRDRRLSERPLQGAKAARQ